MANDINNSNAQPLIKWYPYSFDPKNELGFPGRTAEMMHQKPQDFSHLSVIDTGEISLGRVDVLAYDCNYDALLCRLQKTQEFIIVDNADWDEEPEEDEYPAIDLEYYAAQVSKTIAEVDEE